MIEKKTAALLAVCCEIGGYIGGANPEVVSKLRLFGKHLGLAFQIQDDLLDIMAEEKHLGKTWGSDIIRKKKTLLLIQAKKMAREDDKNQIEHIMNKPDITSQDVIRMKDLFVKTGALEYSQKLLQEHFQKARENLKNVCTAPGKKLLMHYLETVLQRTN